MKLYETWKNDDYGHVKMVILAKACQHGEVHADDVADLALGERNMVGAAFNSLRGGNLIQSTGEHRPNKSPASHGRRSYVYRPTAQGRSFYETVKDYNMPKPKQEGLF